MRIIAGKFRSRKLLSPPVGATTRPMPDRVKESLFSLLRGHFEGATVLDAFAGTGAIGLEAVSRGASRVVMIERDKRTAEVIRRNIEMLGCTGQAEVIIADMLGASALARVPRPIDLVFFDPPYPLVTDPLGWDRVRHQFAAAVQLLADDGFAVLRTPWPFRLTPPQAQEAGESERDLRRDPEPRKRRSRNERRWDWRSEFEGPHQTDADDHDPEARDDEPDADRDETLDLEDDLELADGLDDADGPGVEGAGDPESAEAIAARFPLVDLAIPGARGPETHVYRHTGVHLYMKAAPAPPAAGPGPHA
jgi:16S rRNA (guanine966-N2)-methyltransferase